MNAFSYRAFVFLLLTMAYPVTSFLWRHGYPFFTPEVGLMYLGIAGAALVVAAMLAGVRPGIAHSLCALVVVLAMTVQFDLKFVPLVALVALLAALVYATREKFVSFGIPVIAAMTLGAFFDAGNGSAVETAGADVPPVHASQPPVIHILLDSMIGLEGIPAHPNADQVRGELVDFFDEYGFTVFSKSYSRYTHTGDSVYSAFNFTNSAESTYQWEALGRMDHVLRSNRYFEQLADAGYHFRIFQTEHIDFCQFDAQRVDLCRTYQQPNVRSVRAMERIHDRVRVLANLVVAQSTLARDTGQGMLSGGNLGIAMHDPDIFRDVGRSLASAAAGTVHFAHVLLPHGPYAFSRDCHVDYGHDVEERYASKMNETVPDAALLEKRNSLYLEQVQCTLRSLRQMLTRLQASGTLERSLVIFHGDHGSTVASRMARKEYRTLLTPQDYLSHYSTLFALRYPGGGFRVVENSLSLDVLFRHLARQVSETGLTSTAVEAWEAHWSVDSLPADDPYVYLSGTYPLLRIDVDIFEPRNPPPD